MALSITAPTFSFATALYFSTSVAILTHIFR
jgi:hypothetical protein